jgi:hypothetical protein
MNVVLKPAVSIESLEAGNVDADAFDHEAHIYAAWLYLERWPLQEAIMNFRAAIIRLTIKLGAETKYHETITWFFMLLINQRRVETGASTWAAFRQHNADLIKDAGETLHRYYSEELLASEAARQHYLLPDQLA